MKPASEDKNRKPNLIVLFDGVCALCDWSVQFLLKRDKQAVLKFAPLQGPTAAAILKRHPEIEDLTGSIILVQDYNTPTESSSVSSQAILDCLSTLRGFWRIVSWLRIVPRFIRDPVYNLIAKKRYKWFGKYEECMVPSVAVRDRFFE